MASTRPRSPRRPARGVLVGTLDPFYAGAPNRRDLLLGYGGLSTDDLARGARILADVIGRAAEGRGSSSGATPVAGRSRGGP